MSINKRTIMRAEAAITPLIKDLNRECKEPEGDDKDFSSKMSAFWEMDRYQRLLRKYIDSWIRSDRDFNKWEKQNTSLSNNLNLYIGRLKCKLQPQPDGSAQIGYVLTGLPLPHDPEMRAYTWFIRLVRSMLFNRIGKCNQCESYYIAKTAHKTLYCSRSCAKGNTAIKSTRKRLQRERDEKIKRTRQAIQEFRKRNPKTSNWKLWVAKRADVTQKWITQAFNRGDLPNAKNLGGRN